MRKLMKDLEDARTLQKLHVDSYGLHDSTLEEVFLKVSLKYQMPKGKPLDLLYETKYDAVWFQNPLTKGTKGRTRASEI